jgi:hypothetical protein
VELNSVLNDAKNKLAAKKTMISFLFPKKTQGADRFDQPPM